MTRVAGFTIERTMKGKPAFARIDLCENVIDIKKITTKTIAGF